LSQAVSYGDDYTAATNYPLVRLAFNNTGHLYYCRTSGFSKMGVATGTAKHRFQFKVLSSLTETGPAVLVVSVNGISADMIQLGVAHSLRQFLRIRGIDSSKGLRSIRPPITSVRAFMGI